MGAGASTGLPAAAPIDAEAVAAEVAACLRDDLPDDAAKLETGVRAETRTVLQHLQYFKEHREKMDKLFATVSPEGDVLRHKAFDAALAPRMRQQKPGGGVVETLGDVYAGAKAAKVVFDAAITRAAADAGLEPDAVVLPPLKGPKRAAEKAADDYAERVPGPAVSWLFDIARASVVVNSEGEIAALLAAFPRVSGHGPTGGLLGSGGGGNAEANAPPVEMVRLKNRFAKPTSSGFRDMNALLRVRVGDDFFFICELQIHHATIRRVEKASRSHEVYEFFRSYFRGNDDTVRTRISLLQRAHTALESSSDDWDQALVNAAADDDADAALALAELVSLGGDSAAAAGLLRGDARKRVAALGVAPTAATADQAADALARYAAAVASVDDAAAIRCLRRCLSLRQRTRSDERRLGDAADALGTLLVRRGAANEGAPLLREALAIRAKGGSAKLGQTLHNLAGALAETATDDTGRREAVDAYRRALRVRASSYGAKSPEVAATLYGCASMLQVLDRAGAARAALERALRIYEGAFGPDHPRADDARRRLAAARRRSGDVCGSLELALVAARASAAEGGPGHASDLLEVAGLLNALDADRAVDVLRGEALGSDDAIARMTGAELLDAVQRLDADAPAATPPRGTHPSLALHDDAGGGAVLPPALAAIDEEEEEDADGVTALAPASDEATASLLRSLASVAGSSVATGAGDDDGLSAEDAPKAFAPGDDAGRDNKIVVQKWLASGAEGDVYKVRDAEMGPLAMKCVKLAAGGDPAARRKALCAEASLVGRLRADSPFIASLRYATTNRPGLFVTFSDLAVGGSLSDALEARVVGGLDAAAVAGQLGSALAHAHARGILHCDVKPENMLVVGGDEERLLLKLTDFGLAACTPEPTAAELGKSLAEAAPPEPKAVSSLPMGELRGCTRKYASPEIAYAWRTLVKGKGAPADAAPLEPRTSDLWAAALTVFEVIAAGTGAQAWPGGGEGGLAALEAYAAKPPAPEFRLEAIASACGDDVAKCLEAAKDPFQGLSYLRNVSPLERARYEQCVRSYRHGPLPAALLAWLRAALSADVADRPDSSAALVRAAIESGYDVDAVERDALDEQPPLPSSAYIGFYNNVGNAFAALGEAELALRRYYASLILAAKQEGPERERTLSNAASCLKQRVDAAYAAASTLAAAREQRSATRAGEAAALESAAERWRGREERIVSALQRVAAREEGLGEMSRLEEEWRTLWERCLAELASIDSDALAAIRELARIHTACEELLSEVRAWIVLADAASDVAADAAAKLEDATDAVRAGAAAMEAAAAGYDRTAGEAGGLADAASALVSKYQASDDAARTLVDSADKLSDLSAEEISNVNSWKIEFEKALAENVPATAGTLATSATCAQDASVAAAATCREPLAAYQNTSNELEDAQSALASALEELATERSIVAELVDRAALVAEKSADDGELAGAAWTLIAGVATRIAGLAADELAMTGSAARVAAWRQLLQKRRGELELAERICTETAKEAAAAFKRAMVLGRDLKEHGDAIAERHGKLLDKVECRLEAMTRCLDGGVVLGREPVYEARQLARAPVTLAEGAACKAACAAPGARFARGGEVLACKRCDSVWKFIALYLR